MEPGNPEPLRGTGSQKIRMAVPEPVISPPQPHHVLSSYGLITGFVVDKDIFFKCASLTTEHGDRVGVSERTRVCLTARNRHQVANDN